MEICPRLPFICSVFGRLAVKPVLVAIMSFIQLLQRSYKALNPPNQGVKDNAIRFGLLGASGIASVLPFSFFEPSIIVIGS